MTNTAHTPTPWDIGRYTVGETQEDMVLITACPKKLKSGITKVKGIADLKVKRNGEANAAFIVKACNAHDDLVWYMDMYTTGKHLKLQGKDYTEFCDGARSALAKAKVQQVS